MKPITYQRPSSLADARAIMSDDPDAKYLAGGMTLIPSMKLRLDDPSQLLDISRLAELQGIDGDATSVTVGAGESHRSVARDQTLAQYLPSLAQLARQIGDPQIRARGTLGGVLATSDPAADYPAGVLALNASIKTDQRDIAADHFFVDLFETALAEAEIIVSVQFQVPQRAAYAKFSHPASGFAMTGVFVAQYADSVRVTVTGAGPKVFRWAAAEQALQQSFSVASLATLKMDEAGLNTDFHAPAKYRANLVDVMTRRAVEACLEKQ